ncbi:hypothetical protein ACIO8G_12875 [Streptomyces sp. NPDC087219]|uniref:hypothetical protein n=1 Tax=Streptomyces sp. NPDC087219 TaxID=3365770 RepID=UPI0037F872DA
MSTSANPAAYAWEGGVPSADHQVFRPGGRSSGSTAAQATGRGDRKARARGRGNSSGPRRSSRVATAAAPSWKA